MGLFSRKRKDAPQQPAAPQPTTEADAGRADDEGESLETTMADQADLFLMVACGGSSTIDPDAFDYSLDSLRAVDDYLGRYHETGEPLPDGNLVAASAYVSETLRATYGGRYLLGPDQQNPLVLVVGEPDCRIGVMVMGKVHGRTVNGPEDSIPFFADGIPGLLARQVDATLV